MNYPPQSGSNYPRPQRRPTYGGSSWDEDYDDDYDDAYLPTPIAPQRRPVGTTPTKRPLPDTSSGSRGHRPQDAYGAPPVSSPITGKYSYNWPQGAQQAASGYTEAKSTLVYPEEVVYEDIDHDPPPPAPQHPSRGYPPPEDDFYENEYTPVTQGFNDMSLRNPPVPPPGQQSPYAAPTPKLQVSPYEQRFPTASYPNERYHMNHQTEEYDDDPFQDQYPGNGVRRSHTSTHNIPHHIDMPEPSSSNKDVLHPLPPTPRSPPYMYSSPSLEPRSSLSRHGSGQRPGTRSSTSSMYSYDRTAEEDYQGQYENDEYTASPSSFRSNSLGRTGTLLPVQRKPSYGTLRVDTEDLQQRPVPPPPPPPHLQLTSPSTPPRGHTASNSFSGSSPPIYRSRTEPGHYRSSSSNEPFAPPPPPKLPLNEGMPKHPSVLRSQSHSAVNKSPSRSPSQANKLEKDTSALVLPSEENPLSPVTDSAQFPLSSHTFKKCTEPWSLSALRTWIQDIFGSSVSMETISLALQGLFTHHVSTLSTLQADKLAAQVGTTWLREGVLFEPTVANTAHWNPLSTLEMSFTPFSVEGVIPTLTGKGCYSTSCPTAPPGLGRCYSHCCSRTLVKKSSLPPPSLPVVGKTTDWPSFWNLDEDFLRTTGKREVKRQNVIFEFIQSEEEYCTDLGTMLQLFQKSLITGSTGLTPIIRQGRLDGFIKTVFGNVKPILDWQTKKLLTPLRERQAQQGPVVKGIGDIVLEWVRGCRLIYADYAGGYPYADSYVRDETSSNPLFASWLEADPACRRLPLNHFLQAPNRKIQRVLLLFAEIIKQTEETNRDREILQRATDELKDIVHEADARIAETSANLARQELDQKLVFKSRAKIDLGLQDATRKVIHRGDVSRKSDNKLEWLDIHLILLDNFFIMTKKRRDRGVDRYWISKVPIPIDLLVLEGVTGDAVAKPTVGKLVGTMTTTVSVAPQPLNRKSTNKPIPRNNSVGSGGEKSPDLTLVTSLTAKESDRQLIYPFSITHLSSSGYTYTFYAESANARQQWVEHIMEAKNARAKAMSEIEPFQAKIVAESVFGQPMTLDQLSVKPPALVELSTMHRALSALRAEPFGSRTLGRAITLARINCAKSFIAPDGTDYAHQRLVAVGTDDGVYIGHTPEMSGLCTQWTKVLQLKESTQIDVLEEFGVFLVLANKELIAYSLAGLIPQLPGTVSHIPPIARQPQRLSGSSSVGFFATGKLKDRMLVLYKKKSGVNAVFKALEPVVGKADTNRRNLFSRKKAQAEFFREYDDFFIATDCFGLFTFKNTMAIPTQKGFEVLSLDSKDVPSTIPDLSAPHMAHLARRLDGTRALGMFRISDKEFLLCYDECAIYVDKHGEVSRSKIINWHGKPRATQVIDGKYVLAFDTSFIEIWRCDGEFGEGGVSLVQVIPGRDIRMIGKEERKADLGLGPGTGYFNRVYVAMGHPERGDRQIIVEIIARVFY